MTNIARQWLLRALAITALLTASCNSAQPIVESTATPSLTSPTTSTTTTTTSTTLPVTTTSYVPPTAVELCLRRAVFADSADSDYVLPYPVGTGYTMFQGYCRDDTSHEEQPAYDFAMPIGSQVTAARAGIVRQARDDVSDTDFTRELNYLFIEHEDGSAAFYAHLMQDSISVAVGDEVEAGDPIALSGSSGRTGEILHFGVHTSYQSLEGTDIGVNFRNAEGLLDSRGGLRDGTFYRALPDPSD